MLKSPFERYVKADMREVFSDQRKFEGWRGCWIALAEAEKELGLEITDEQIEVMKRHVSDIDFERAKLFERGDSTQGIVGTKHDVMAHIKHYAEQCPAAKRIIHLGGTSMLVCDNTELLQTRDALEIIRDKTVKGIDLVAQNAEKYKDMPCLGFTHLQPAQPVTVGKRFALWGYELRLALEDVEYRLAGFKGRGAKGTTGTQASYLKLFDGDPEKVRELDRLFSKKLGFDETFLLTGQTSPRLFQYQIASTLGGLATVAHKTGMDIRLLQFMKEMEEPTEAGKTGSSAMAYKRNPTRSERMCGLARYVMGLPAMEADTTSVQMFERTLDDSSIRRVTIPEIFYATDAMMDLYLFVMSEPVVYPEMINKHLTQEVPFMATENIIMAAVKKGGDRQDIHERIKTYSMEAGARVKAGKDNDLLKRIANDTEIPLDKGEISAIASNYEEFIGMAPYQVDIFLKEIVDPLRKKYPKALELKSSVEI